MITVIGMLYSLILIAGWCIGIVITGTWPPQAFTLIIGLVVLAYLGLDKFAEIVAKKVEGGAYNTPEVDNSTKIDKAETVEAPITGENPNINIPNGYAQ